MSPLISNILLPQVKKNRQTGIHVGSRDVQSVFAQMTSKKSQFSVDDYCLPHRVWKVKFIGESVDDCGGGYSESIAEMCEELQSGSLPLLIPTPNSRDDGSNTDDYFILNPQANSKQDLEMFHFLGKSKQKLLSICTVLFFKDSINPSLMIMMRNTLRILST